MVMVKHVFLNFTSFINDVSKFSGFLDPLIMLNCSIISRKFYANLQLLLLSLMYFRCEKKPKREVNVVICKGILFSFLFFKRILLTFCFSFQAFKIKLLMNNSGFKTIK